MAEHLDFEDLYREQLTPWDVPGPQPALSLVAEEGGIVGRVIDLGCGTGENALFLAASGLAVTGVDTSRLAVEEARRKAAERGLTVTFAVGDVLALDHPPRSFDSAVDSGCFHVFDDAERPRYVTSVRRVLRRGGRLFVLCFSDRQHGSWGPRRVSQEELRAAFGTSFAIEDIRATEFAMDPPPRSGTVQAWLAALTAR